MPATISSNFDVAVSTRAKPVFNSGEMVSHIPGGISFGRSGDAGVSGDGANGGLESAMPAATVQELIARGHQLEVINDSYQDFGAGQFIWRMGDPAVQGYQAASDPRRDGQAVGF